MDHLTRFLGPTRRLAVRTRLTLERVPLGPFTLRGNDGLTVHERQVLSAQFKATAGNPRLGFANEADHQHWQDEVRMKVTPFARPGRS